MGENGKEKRRLNKWIVSWVTDFVCCVWLKIGKAKEIFEKNHTFHHWQISDSKADTNVCNDQEVVFPAHDFEDVEQFLPEENESEESEGEDNKQHNDDQDLTENGSENSDDDSE